MDEAADKLRRLREAIKKIEKGRASVRAAAKELSIPRSTLFDKLKLKSPREYSNRTELSIEEEEGLVKWITGMSDRGFGRNKASITGQVKRILDAQGRQTKFKNNLPGKDWYHSFLKRHPVLTSRSPLQLSKQRALVTPRMVETWFRDFKDFMEEEVKDKSIWVEPERWFNADESGFPFCPKTGKVICSKESSHVYNFTNSNKNVVTVMACLSAGGSYVQPMIVYAGTRFNYNPLEGFEEAAFGRSQSGWMDSELFYTWLKNVFVHHLDSKNIKRPVVLFVDGHRTHLTMEASDVCMENGIILYCLLENASHLMQPCDLRLFSSLKSSYKKAVSRFHDENPGDIVTKKTFTRVFRQAWEEASRPEIAQGGFSDAGLYPLDPSRVVESPKLKPCQLFYPQTSSQSKVSETSSSTQSIIPEASFSIQNIKPEVSSNVVETSNIFDALDLAGSNLRTPQSECTCPCTCGARKSTPWLKTAFSETPSKAVSFHEIPLPQANIPKTNKKKGEKIPKAATGSVFRQLLQAKKQRKENEEKAKEERKRMREEKKRKAQEEKERKKDEKAIKKQKKKKDGLKMTLKGFPSSVPSAELPNNPHPNQPTPPHPFPTFFFFPTFHYHIL